jgi:transcription elongation factor GreA
MASLQARFTREGYERLQAELEELKKQRAALREEIKDARELGDLKENAGYHAAREAQGITEAKIAQLEQRLEDAVIVDESTSFDKVALGVPVTVQIEGAPAPRTYVIVASEEMDYVDNAASEASPIGQALLGKAVGDTAEIMGPKGLAKIEILKIGA